MSVFSFFKSGKSGLGTGTADLGFVRSQSIGLTSVAGPGVTVRRSLGPTRPGLVQVGNRIVPVVAITGLTGSQLSGTNRLATLAERAKG